MPKYELAKIAYLFSKISISLIISIFSGISYLLHLTLLVFAVIVLFINCSPLAKIIALAEGPDDS